MADRLAGLVLPDRTPVEKPRPLAGSPAATTGKPEAPAAGGRRRWRLHRPRGERGDWLIAASGIALGVICALFPWYIFFNQEQFGVRPLRFEGQRARLLPPERLAYQPSLIGPRSLRQEMGVGELDQMAVGTVEQDRSRAVPLDEQPFPGPPSEFRLIHVTAGRAMIEDADGFWIVQRGARLPDGSRVAAIEKREGTWALVTSRNQVVTLSP
ncbi:hypothetical protein N1F89_10260 [Aquibium sp. A9E412]|uniref:hypothetical protein n=1 Tax=Aquibium sp. A9E412 TaxID=2976767 RepID=UPI0025AED69C|nr:hypothetical protein [Aquibium sp. A9E412]MDN2566605.1 hypothetical protein [Aquibium sp. A9E412]